MARGNYALAIEVDCNNEEEKIVEASTKDKIAGKLHAVTGD